MNHEIVNFLHRHWQFPRSKHIARFLLSLLVWLLASLSNPAAAQVTSAPTCAGEGGTCTITAASVVMYGADTRWVAKTTSTDQACSNKAFGRDPAPRVVKKCVKMPLQCGSENGVCPLTQASVVIYGAGTRWNAKYYDSAQSVNCTNGNFGDPARGATKTCRVVPVSLMTKCDKNQSCFSVAAGDPSINATASGNSYNVGVAVAASATCTGASCLSVRLATVTLSEPSAVKGNPEVAGCTLTKDQITASVNWIFTEVQVYKTPMCWRSTYDRGIGIAPGECGTKQLRGALCYDKCRAGYSDHGTLTCSQNCPSGYTDTGLLCHYNGSASYSPVHWDSCHSKAPWWLGGGCIGAFVEDGCRGGYHKFLSVCYLDLPADMTGSSQDPVKHTYNLSPSSPTCNSNRELQAGLCYLPARSGYACNVTVCGANCAAGTTTCGPGACSADTASCVQGITNMVMSPLIVIAGVVTDEAASTAVTEAKASVKAAAAAKKAGDTAGLALAIKGVASATENMMLIAEADISKVSTSQIGDAIAAKYGRGTPNYKAIARKWTQTYIALSSAELAQAFTDVAVSATDVTGIVGTIQAYNLHICTQHTPMP